MYILAGAHRLSDILLTRRKAFYQTANDMGVFLRKENCGSDHQQANCDVHSAPPTIIIALSVVISST